MITPRKIAGATLFYNPSIRTDLAGKARITFTLPDMMGDVRIRAIGNTKDSHFAYAEKVISIRKDYHIVATTPTILHSGDISQLGVQITHTTNKITATTLTVSIGTAPNILQKSVDIILNPHESVSRIFPLESTSIWGNIVPYRVELREKNTLLDSFSGSF